MSTLLARLRLVHRDSGVDFDPNCTLNDCPVEASYYQYRVSLAANVTFLVLFVFSLTAFVVTDWYVRRTRAFTVAFVSGVTLEILGYVGRTMSWHNQWNESGFLMQIVCLTIAPAFLAGGIYLCLRRIVYAFGPGNSRISPEAYTRIFIPCDLFSLVLQATGGGMASQASHEHKSTKTGDDIMIAGLAFQVITLGIFMLLCLDFAIHTWRRRRELGAEAFDQTPAFQTLRSSWTFKGFLYALALATICVFWRSVYRVIELAQGWEGDLIARQDLFIGFEGVMVLIACLVLNAFHPAWCLGEVMDGQGGIGSRRKARKAEQAEDAGVGPGAVQSGTASGDGAGEEKDAGMKHGLG